jgi:hypothetical protein
MSFMSAIMGKSASEQAPQHQQQSVQQVTQQQQAPEPVKQVEIPDPMAVYSKMFEDAAKVTTEGPPAFNLDSETLSKVSSQMDFMKGVPQDLMERASGGDVKALMELMQHTNRNAYAAALDHGTKLTDTYMGRRGEYDKSAVQSSVKTSLLDQAVSSQANLKNPLVKQEVARIAREFAKSSPDANPSEIVQQAMNYFNDIHAAITPQQSQEQQNKQAGQVDDWEAFLTQ